MTKMDQTLIPRMQHWYEGVQQVFENLGAGLDMEKVTKSAKQRMEEEQRMRDEMQRAQADLEEFLRTQKALENQKKRDLEKRVQSEINAVKMDLTLSNEEKKKKIQEILDRGNKEKQLLDQLAQRMGEDQRLIRRARQAIEQQQNPMARAELQAYRQKVQNTLKDVASNLAPGMSLLQVGNAEQAASKFAAVEHGYRKKTEERDQQDHEWEALLDRELGPPGPSAVDQENLRR